MPVPINQSQVPWSALDGGTATDAVSGDVAMRVTITVTGSVAQVQADYATLAATSLTSRSSTISNDL